MAPTPMSSICLRMLDLKGALNDILENIDIKLDPMFISSLIHDLIKVRFPQIVFSLTKFFKLCFFLNVGNRENYTYNGGTMWDCLSFIGRPRIYTGSHT
jgi:hypothetical protein